MPHIDSETFLFYAAIAAYGLYLATSAALTFSLKTDSRRQWPTAYTVAMLPAILMTSWPVRTAAWPEGVIPGSDLTLIACVVNNLILAYGAGWILLGLSRALRGSTVIMRLILCVTAITVPILFWVLQVWLVLHHKGL